jgi:YidC/Oxa1 family membrane protein insertase
MSGSRNYIVAIALSLAVLFGWQFFVAGPQLEAQRKKAEAEQALHPTSPPAAAVTAGSTVSGSSVLPSPAGAPGAAGQVQDRATTIAATPRVKIDTASFEGSINLVGGRLDDLSLKHYHETIDPKSANIVLLAPAGTGAPYYTEIGWQPDVADPVKIPTRDSKWTPAEPGDLTRDHPVVLTYDNGEGWVFKRTYAVDDKYMFTVTDEVTDVSGKPASLKPFSAVHRDGTPKVSGNWLVHEGLIGVVGSDGLKEEKVTYKDIKDKHEEDQAKTTGGWIGFVDKYWATVLIPDSSKAQQPIFASSLVGSVDTYQSYMVGEPVALTPGASATSQTRIFAGAKEVQTLNAYEADLKIEKLNLMIDWGWFWFLTQPMFFVLDYLYKLTGNFGIAILLTTVGLKALFFPLANKSYDSMSKMKKLQPEMKEIQARFADDKPKQQQATMELYKRERINPVAGCVPVVLQIPVFFSLYKVLFITIEMRHAPFYGWVHDLASPDPTSLFNLFGLIPFTPPQALMIGVWPLIMGVTMFVQMKLNPAPPDPTQKLMFDWMPLIFTFTLSSFPAGLVIYWAWNNSLSILQQTIIMKKNGVKIELWDNIRGMFSFLKRRQG